MADVPAEAIVCLDETSTQITMTRRRGRALAGVRLTERVPRNRGDNLRLLAAIGTDGVKAPLVVPRALDGDVFAQWVSEWLVPTLRPGQVVVQDTRSVHKDGACPGGDRGGRLPDGVPARRLAGRQPD